MDLVDKIAFVIEDKGWKNCHLVDFVVQSAKEKKLQEDLVDENTLKKLKYQEIMKINNYKREVTQYRIKPFDLIQDVWLLQRRYLFFLWISCGVGSKKEVSEKLNQLLKETK